MWQGGYADSYRHGSRAIAAMVQPPASDVLMIWFVIALGLFCDDCYRQIYRWLVPWKKGNVPGRSTDNRVRSTAAAIMSSRITRISMAT